MDTQAAMSALYRALVYDADALLAPAKAQTALRAVCRAMLAGGVFDDAAVLKPGRGAQGWTDVLPRGGEPAAMVSWPELCAAAARSWQGGCVEVAPSRGGSGCAIVAPVRRAGRVHLLLALRCADGQPPCADAASLVGWVVELLGRALDDLDLKSSLMLDCARRGYVARHDAATGLPNALAFSERLEREAALGGEPGYHFAAGLLQGLRAPRGASWNDAAARDCAQQLQAALRHRDFIARLGDDVFGLLIRDLEPGQPRQALERMLGAWAARSRDGAGSCHGPARIGLVLVRAARQPAAELLDLARGALDALEGDPAPGVRWRIVQPPGGGSGQRPS